MANSSINLNGTSMKIRDNLDSTFSTSTSKTNISTQIFTALSITDVLNHDSALIDVTMLEEKSIFVNNGLNQPLTLTAQIYDPTGTYAYSVSTTIAAGTAYLVTRFDLPIINMPFTSLKIRLSCAIAPASGAVNAWLIGR